MNVALTSTVPADELCLAQLACAKLGRLVQGALSIGLPALVSGVPAPRPFLETQFRVMTGFALVLHTVSAVPGGQQEVFRLREKSREVLAALESLEGLLLEHLASTGPPLRPFQAARNAANDLCDALGDYAELVQKDRSRIVKVKEVVLQVFDGVESLARDAHPAAS